jgi:hypothetical protein
VAPNEGGSSKPLRTYTPRPGRGRDGAGEAECRTNSGNKYAAPHGFRVRALPPAGPGAALAKGGTVVGLLGALGAGQTNLQLTEPLLWTMLGISVAGAIVTFAFLVYAVWKFRDPKTRRRRYG